MAVIVASVAHRTLIRERSVDAHGRVTVSKCPNMQNERGPFEPWGA